MDVPKITHQEYTLIDITNAGFVVALIAHSGHTRDDLRLPGGELGDKIRKEFERSASQVLVSVFAFLSFQ